MPSVQYKENMRLGTVSIKNTDTSHTQTINVTTIDWIVAKITLYENYQLAPGQTLDITPLLPSVYTLTIKDNIDNTTTSYNFTYVGSLEKYFIKRAMRFLCNDCKECCNDCEENKNCDEKKCNPYYELINQAIFLNHWFDIPGSYIKDTTSSIHHASMMNEICKSTLEVELKGNDCCFNELMFKRLILSYYTGFYYTIKKYINDTVSITNKAEEIAKLDEKYQILKLEQCINKYGQPLSVYENLFP